MIKDNQQIICTIHPEMQKNLLIFPNLEFALILKVFNLRVQSFPSAYNESSPTVIKVFLQNTIKVHSEGRMTILRQVDIKIFWLFPIKFHLSTSIIKDLLE